MATITPTLSLIANSSAHASLPGPMSSSLSMSVTGALAVDLVDQGIYTVTTTRSILGNDNEFDGSVIGGSYVPGNDGGFVYLNNLDTTTGNNIHVAVIDARHASNPPPIPAEDGNTTSLDGRTQESLRTFTLKPGEFCWMPWDYIGDIYVESAQNSPKIEWWKFDRA